MEWGRERIEDSMKLTVENDDLKEMLYFPRLAMKRKAIK